MGRSWDIRGRVQLVVQVEVLTFCNSRPFDRSSVVGRGKIGYSEASIDLF